MMGIEAAEEILGLTHWPTLVVEGVGSDDRGTRLRAEAVAQLLGLDL
ncbi:MAG TPA: hypothetical protein VLL52_00905 [Anaerolineae bacterium]|nr:hypothetical protein [Anaerolineae bacterium]